MVSIYFGLIGCGKTTLMVAEMIKYHRKFPKKNVYCNVGVNLPWVIKVSNDDVGMFNIHDGKLFLDEGTLFADSRDYKSFDKGKISFFLLSRHYKTDIAIFTQQWDGVDRKIRVITDRVYYVYKLKLLPFLTKYYRIPYGIIIPDPKKSDTEKYGEIVQGYYKPNFLIRIFSPIVYRPKYYKYFDSYEAPILPDLPQIKPKTEQGSC